MLSAFKHYTYINIIQIINCNISNLFYILKYKFIWKLYFKLLNYMNSILKQNFGGSSQKYFEKLGADKNNLKNIFNYK